MIKEDVNIMRMTNKRMNKLVPVNNSCVRVQETKIQPTGSDLRMAHMVDRYFHNQVYLEIKVSISLYIFLLKNIHL